MIQISDVRRLVVARVADDFLTLFEHAVMGLSPWALCVRDIGELAEVFLDERGIGGDGLNFDTIESAMGRRRQQVAQLGNGILIGAESLLECIQLVLVRRDAFGGINLGARI